MFRRPSARRKSEQQELTINLVPMLDALVTLVSFLLMTMGYLAISAIETPAPMLAPAEEQIKDLKEKKEIPLQLTADIRDDNTILLHDWMGSRFNVKIEARDDPGKPGEKTYDVEKFHQSLMAAKTCDQKKHLDETQIILKPSPGVSYENLVALMDAARAYSKTDIIPDEVRTTLTKARADALARLEQAKKEQKQLSMVIPAENELFSNVIFGNILSNE